ncbi:MAG: hypothetical protein J2P18_14045 [Nocardia sp.]|nr:hypothetical protein [Nocardia sp.]
MAMTGSKAAQIRDVLRRYDRALAAADASAVAELYSAYGAHFPGRHPEAFGIEIEDRYRWLFGFQRPPAGHELREVITTAGLTFAVTVQRDAGQADRSARQLFVFSDFGGQWKILASIQELAETNPPARTRPGIDRLDVIREVRSRLCATNSTMLATAMSGIAS